MSELSNTLSSRSNGRAISLRAVMAASILGGALFPQAAAEAQSSYVRVSVKFVLDGGGSRPTSGYYYQDSHVQTAITQANAALSNMGADWALDLVEIVDAPGISQWFGPMDCNDKGAMETAAEANKTLYKWKDDAVNIYVVNDLIQCGGVCSFPQYNHDIIVIQSVGGIMNGGIGWLHELGHYFNLYHTFQCLSGLGCSSSDPNVCLGAGGEGQLCPDSCPHTTNVMSYNAATTSNAVLSPCQLGLVAAEMDPNTGRRKAVVDTQPLDPAVVTSPSNGATLSGSTQAFTWSAGTNVTQYWLEAGTTSAASAYFSQDMGTSTSHTVTGLPTDGSTVRVTVWSSIGSSWTTKYNDYVANAGAAATISSPSAGSTFSSSSQAFTWSSGSGVTQYWLEAGTTSTPGAYFSQGMGTSTSYTITGLPTDGSAVRVRLWSLLNGQWATEDADYTAASGGGGGANATISTPSAGATLSGSSQAFTWSTGTGVTQYWLEAGTTSSPGAYFSQDMSTSTSYTITGLPTDGSTVRVRLWSYRGGQWYTEDADYTAASGGGGSANATISTPSAGANLSGSSQAFTWSTGTGVTQYWLEAGTTSAPGAYFSQDMGTSTSHTITGLPTNGGTIRVRLWSYRGGQWYTEDADYTAASGGGGANAVISSPTAGAALAGSSQAFFWTAGVGVSQYWLEAGTTSSPGAYFSQNMNSATSNTISGLPTDSSTIRIRLWSYRGGQWYTEDADFTAAAGGGGSANATISSPSAGSTLSGSSQAFTWSTGTGVTQYWLEAGTTSSPGAYFSQNMNTSTSHTITVLPTDGSTVRVRLWSYRGGQWYTEDADFTAASGGSGTATMSSPSAGSTLAGASQAFTWSTGTGVTQYWLEAGTTASPAAYFSQDMGTSTSQTVTGLPTNSSAVRVRLWSLKGGAWSFNVYDYTAGA